MTGRAHRGRLTLAGLALTLAAFFAAPAPAREFRAADIQAGDYPTVQAIEYMNRLIVERSGGRHSIRLFHSRQLGEEMDTIEQTRQGAIDINRINVAPLMGAIPELKPLGLPFLFRSTDHLHQALDGPIGDELLASLEPYGFVGLTFYDSGARSLYNDVRPVRSPADMKGLRIRVQQSALAEQMIAAMGAQPVVLPYGQVLTGLATKLVDGAENNWPSYVSTDHFRHARYYTLTEHSMAPEVLIMSKKAWDALDAADRALFRQAARDSSRFMRAQWLAWEERSRREAEAAGNVIIADVDKAAFADAMADIYKQAAADPKIAAFVQRIRDLR